MITSRREEFISSFLQKTFIANGIWRRETGIVLYTREARSGKAIYGPTTAA